MSRIQKKSFGDNDAVFGRRGGLNIKNTLLRTLIRRNSGAYCAIVQHLANDKRKFVVKHVMDPLVAAGGKLYLSDDSGIRELKPSRQKDLLLIITKIQQALRDEKKKIMKKMEKKQSKSSKSNKGSTKGGRTTLSREEHNAITTPSLYVFAAAEDHALSALPPLAVTPSMVPVPAGTNNNGSLYPSPTQEEEDESTTTTASSYDMTPMPRARTRQQKRRASSLSSKKMTTRAPATTVYSVPSVSPTLELGSRPAPPEEEEEDSSTSEEEHEETDDEEEQEQFEDAPEEEEEEDTTSPQEQEEDISNATPMTDEVDHDMVKSLFGALRTGNWVQS